MTDKNINFYEEMETYYIAERSDEKKIWYCVMENDEIIPLVLSVRVCDEFPDIPEELEEFEDELYEITFEVMVHKDHISKDYLKDIWESSGMGEGFTIDDLQYFDILGYGGGVTYVDPLSINPDSYNKDYFVKGSDNMVYMKNYDFEELKKFVIERVPAIFGLIGFVLDRQTRGLGCNGWDEIERLTKNASLMELAKRRRGIK